MPFIKTTTTKTITKEQENTLKNAFGKAIEIIPGKTEAWLMLDFVDNQRMSFKGDNVTDCAMVEVDVFGQTSASDLDKLTKEICKILKETLNLEGDRVYVKYRDVSSWGYDSSNF